MQTAAQITDNYRAVRARLWGSPTVGRVVLPPRAKAPEKPAVPEPINWKIAQVKGRNKRRKALPQGVFEPTVQAARAAAWASAHWDAAWDAAEADQERIFLAWLDKMEKADE